jgi:hypothetical protein
MADALKIEMTQVDNETGKPISKASVEWYGMDRHEANQFSLALLSAVAGAIGKADLEKYEGALEKHAPSSQRR